MVIWKFLCFGFVKTQKKIGKHTFSLCSLFAVRLTVATKFVSLQPSNKTGITFFVGFNICVSRWLNLKNKISSSIFFFLILWDTREKLRATVHCTHISAAHKYYLHFTRHQKNIDYFLIGIYNNSASNHQSPMDCWVNWDGILSSFTLMGKWCFFSLSVWWEWLKAFYSSFSLSLST